MTNPVILFDGVCNLCCGWVQFLIRHDKKSVFRFASLQSKAGIDLCESFNIDTKKMDTVIYIKEGSYYTESAAVFRIINDMGGVWKVFLTFSIIPKAITDFVYRQIAARRYKIFGRKATCFVPTPEIKSKFL